MIKEVSFDEIIDEMMVLLVDHREEVTTHKHLMKLKPDQEKYRQLEEKNMLLCLGAYFNGKLVGYSITFIMPHLHYMDLMISSNDVIYVNKEHRNTRLGLCLIQETEFLSKKRGSQFMLWHAKPGTALAALLPKMGCGLQDLLFSKEL